jgi:threonine aldolase
VRSLRPIDLRSDTVTRPTEPMRRAMCRAEVGDDGRRLPDGRSGDPTVDALEARAAKLFGMPAALFMPSGTMANLVALRTWCPPGAGVAVGATAHIHRRETAAFDPDYLGLRAIPLPDETGLPTVDAVRAALAEDPAVLCLENTHNAARGAAWRVEDAAEVYRAAARGGVPVHLDGARLLNAAVAVGSAPDALAAGAASLTFCLTKGPGAPMGALLLGDAGFVRRALRVRTLLGGQLRQAGIVAAAGLVALDGAAWLASDHRRAARLAHRLSGLGSARVAVAAVPTNIVQILLGAAAPPVARVIDELAGRGVLVQSPGGDVLRLVTHRDLDDADIDRAADVLRAVLDQCPTDGGTP